MELHAHHSLQFAHPMLLLPHTLAHKQVHLQEVNCMAIILTSSRQAGSLPRINYTRVAPLLISSAQGTLQANGTKRSASEHKIQAGKGLCARHLRMLAQITHRQGCSVPDDELAIHAGCGAEWQHLCHTGCLHRVCMPCAMQHISRCKSCSLAYSRPGAQIH